ncbi:hypothetical protein F5Y19DRAFT_458919 [Xylariaceae sp. FL1651]|nr:hypothetical protein F5Y19DRAFT_458919 [Xylariaceae sp. FL1651]
MVFPGRFSTGCKRCRQRKVKCDESRPSCRRCYIYGKPCPGYTDQFHFRFEKTASKQGSASPLPQRQARSPGPWQLQPQNANSNQGIAQAHVRRPVIMPQLGDSYDHVSLCYFVRRFVTPDVADDFPGHLSFLPNLYNHYGHGLLELATLSVAQIAAYNQFGDDKFRLQSYQNYGRAIQALRRTIQTEEEVADDRVIAAVLLLCIFKDIGEGWGDPGEHASGLYYLLEKRGFEQLCTRRGFELLILALLKLQVHSFLHRDDSYSDPGGLVTLLSLFDPMMHAMFLMTKSLRLRHNLLKCDTGREATLTTGDKILQSQKQESSPETDASILKSCFEALEEFDRWDSSAELYWKQSFEGRSVPAALGEVAIRGNYYDPRTACTIILVRSARLVLLLSILEYHDTTQVLSGDADAGASGDKAAWAKCIPVLEQSFRSTIDDMLWCVPFAMGDRDPNGCSASMPQDGAAALIIIQPLRLVTYCIYATPEQRKSSQDALNRINAVIGVRSAVPWGEHSISAPHRPGTQGLIRAMASANSRGTLTLS